MSIPGDPILCTACGSNSLQPTNVAGIHFWVCKQCHCTVLSRHKMTALRRMQRVTRMQWMEALRAPSSTSTANLATQCPLHGGELSTAFLPDFSTEAQVAACCENQVLNAAAMATVLEIGLSRGDLSLFDKAPTPTTGLKGFLGRMVGLVFRDKDDLSQLDDGLDGLEFDRKLKPLLMETTTSQTKDE